MMNKKELKEYILNDFNDICFDWEYKEKVRYKKCLNNLFNDIPENVVITIEYDESDDCTTYYNIYEELEWLFPESETGERKMLMRIKFDCFGWEDVVNNKKYIVCFYCPMNNEAWEEYKKEREQIISEYSEDIIFYV